MAHIDSDEDDTFVTIGTALKPYDEDEPIKKPFQLQDQKVKDEQGRQRFHGAFTGGFSAGFFNTVGSKEGWTPSTFVSSRKDRGERKERRPEDFMDEEDLGEFGIAPRGIHTTEDFTSSQRSRQKRPLVNDGIIPGEAPLSDLIVPARLPIGVRLLRQLGWKEGQGIGPRVNRRRKTKKGHPQDSSKKIYGCSMPGSNGNSDNESSEEDDLDDISLSNVTFAPKDVSPITFVPKDNFHGLGYSGITQKSSSSHFELFEQAPSVGRQGRKGISGQAFGVGALEDEDSDIYHTSNMSQYDRILGDEEADKMHGWTAPTRTGSKTSKGYTEAILEGFKLLSTQLRPKKIYPPPELPRSFKPHHVFSQEEEISSQKAGDIPSKFSAGWKNMDASNRREALGEKPEFKSVFDLISPADRQALEDAKSARTTSHQPSGSVDEKSSSQSANVQPEVSPPVTNAPTQPENSLSNRFQTSSTVTTATTSTDGTTSSGAEPPPPDTVAPLTPPPRSKDPLFKGTLSFKPFAKDKAKQARYEQYIQETRYRKQVGGDIWRDCNLSRRDRDRERDEFARAARLYRPMAGMIASRFTRAKYEDDDDQVEVKEEPEDPTDKEKAVEMKMYGMLTRDIHEWHPSRILCKRFNVPDPYPDSGIVGLKKAKRDKYSVFNFLSFPEGRKDRMPVTNDQETKESSKADKKKKPLAITDSKTSTKTAQVDVGQGSTQTTTQGDSQGSTQATGQGDNQSSTQEDTVPDDTQTVASPERPPLDLFKAIFENSDSEESSPEAEVEMDTEPAPTPQEKRRRTASRFDTSDVVTPNMFNRLFGAGEKVPEESHTPEGSPGSHTPAGSPERIPMSEFPVTTADDALRSRLFPDPDCPENKGHGVSGTNGSDAYGPELPPQLIPAKSREENLPDSSRPKKKKHKEKEKKKHKKKKSKHKKKNHEHKNKKKKKKKTKVVITVSSSDSSDTDSSDSQDVPSDTVLLEKLRTVSGRTSAADYM